MMKCNDIYFLDHSFFFGGSCSASVVSTSCFFLTGCGHNGVFLGAMLVFVGGWTFGDAMLADADGMDGVGADVEAAGG